MRSKRGIKLTDKAQAAFNAKVELKATRMKYHNHGAAASQTSDEPQESAEQTAIKKELASHHEREFFMKFQEEIFDNTNQRIYWNGVFDVRIARSF